MFLNGNVSISTNDVGNKYKEQNVDVKSWINQLYTSNEIRREITYLDRPAKECCGSVSIIEQFRTLMAFQIIYLYIYILEVKSQWLYSINGYVISAMVLKTKNILQF